MYKRNLYPLFGMIVFFCLYSHCLCGQITIQGTVTDKTGTPLAGINVLLNPKGSEKVLTYSLSDNKGFYLLQYNGDTDSLQLTLSSFDYQKVIREIKPISQTLDFSLTDSPINLKEVVVKAEPLRQRGDTLSYLVSAFTGKDDRVIGDVLKKLPGIEVSSSGEISYLGKSINKFYVENADLLQGRYGIATNNISVQDIASVQIYEYHQPIKALTQSTPSDKAALNLTLKNSVRGTWSAVAQLGIGAEPLLWENELISLYFARTMQNINIYKGNNSGNDVSRELNNFYSERNNTMYEGKLLSLLTPVPPEIKVDRYLFNNINMVSTNILRALSNESEIVANINYLNDHQNSNSYSRSSYFLPDENLIVEETLNATQQKDNLNTAIKYTINKDNFYLTNATDLTASWTDNNGMVATIDSINQSLNTTSYNISNKFELIKKFAGDKHYRIYSFNGFVRTPQSLSIHPGLYEEVLNDGLSYNQLRQNSTFSNFTSSSSLSYFMSKYGIRQNYYGGIDVSVQDLNSLLQPVGDNGLPLRVAPDSLQNDLGWKKYSTFLSADYRYFWRKFEINAYLPINYTLLHIDDKLPSNRRTINRLLFNPSLTVRYNPNRYWDIRLNYRKYDNIGTIRDSYTGYIMRNYRRLNKYDTTLSDATTHTVGLRFAYRNPLKALFFHTDLVYEKFKSNLMYDLSYAGILQIQQTVFQPSTSSTYGISGTASKGLYFLSSTVSLTASCHTTSSSQMNQGLLTEYQYDGYWVKPVINSKIASWGSLSLTSLWNESKITIKESSGSSNIRSLSDYITINLFPLRNWTAGVNVEHYYNNVVSEENNKFFTDIHLRYKTSQIEVAAKWANIFNTGKHITASYDGTSEYLHIYEIRPSQILVSAKFKLW